MENTFDPTVPLVPTVDAGTSVTGVNTVDVTQGEPFVTHAKSKPTNKQHMEGFLTKVSDLVGKDRLFIVTNTPCEDPTHDTDEGVDIRVTGMSARELEKLLLSRMESGYIKAIGRNDSLNYVHVDFREGTNMLVKFAFNSLNQPCSHFD